METKKLLKWIGIGLAVFIIPIIIVVCNLTGKCETPPSTCSWQDDSCGAGACASTQRQQTCGPVGCSGGVCVAGNTQCVADSGCAAPPTCSWQDDACGQSPCTPTQRHQTCGPVDCTGGTCTAGQTQCVADTSCVLPTSIQIHFIDVGQGDSILIDSGTNEVLIDGGQKSSGVTVTDYIKQYVDGSLEGLVATHTDADHIGGLIKVLKDFPVEQIWLNGYTATSKTYQDFMDEVNKEETTGAEVNYATKRGGEISIGNLSFSILNPPDTLFSDANNNSIVLRLKYGDIAFLFSGDAEKEAETSILTTGSELQAQILKAGHHCSKTASTKAFLEEVKPEKAICMVGENNRYGHPHQETLTSLKDIGAEIYRTDTNGTIIVSTDGVGYTIRTEK